MFGGLKDGLLGRATLEAATGGHRAGTRGGADIPVVFISADLPSRELGGQAAAVMVKTRIRETEVVETTLRVLRKREIRAV